MAILPKLIYKSNASSVKIPMSFFTEVEKKNPQILTKPQKSLEKNKTILSKKKNMRGIKVPDSKIYYRI